ncbi:MAG: HAD family hydrolase [Cyclobacteriaceae bacterium]
MQFKAVLFDMDGVLVLSEPLHYRAWQEVLGQLPVAADILAENDIIGHTDRQIAQKVARRGNTEINEKELFNLKQNSFLNLIKNGLEAVPGRDEFLQYWQEKAPMAVISSSGRKEIKAVLQQENIANSFRFFVGFEDTGKHKPDPAPYLHAMQKMGVKSSDCLILEDSPSGVKAALASGSTVVGLNTSNLLDENSGVPFFNNYYEILEWLQK